MFSQIIAGSKYNSLHHSPGTDTLPLQFLLPLTAAMVYVAAALILKRASDLGADVWRTTRIINYTTALVAAALWPLGGTLPALTIWWQPAAAGVLFFVGQIFTLLALNLGDVSVATPVLGIKILLVAALSVVLMGDPVSSRLWLAAAVSTVAIVLLNVDRGRPHARVGTTIMLAGLGAVAYASFDVLVQKWSLVWGAGRFVPIATACAAVYSIPLRALEKGSGEKRGRGPFSHDSSEKGPRPLFSPDPFSSWLLAGAVGFAVQGLMFITSVSIFRHVTTANVLYSSRGLWSVVAVWCVGHWFENREQKLGARVLVWRLAGAVLLMSAIVMVLLER